MSDEEAMFAAVQATPEDDTARLVYADAVQERDEDLAALIRRGALCYCSQQSPTMYSVDGAGVCLTCAGNGWVPHCEHDGCRAIGRPCVIEGHVNGEPDDIEEWFCGEHAAGHGYCPSCGAFWGGISTFETRGVCDHCADQHRADFDEDEWDGDIDGIHEYGEDDA